MATKKPEPKPAKRLTKPPVARNKLDEYGVDAVVMDIKSRESMSAISVKVGVSLGTLISWIAADSERSARVREARADTAMLWDQAAEDVLRDADDVFGLAKAREIASHYRWRASKIGQKDYSDRQAVDLTANINVAAEIAAARKRARTND